MTFAPSSSFDADGRNTIEGFARVVAVEVARVVLEPEQGGSCGSCASSPACGAKTSGPNWLQARRFRIDNDDDLEVGERVVVGIPAGTVLRGSLTAYALPLFTLVIGGIIGRPYGDGVAAAATLGGLVFGLLVARLLAGRLSARGGLAPRYIRRARGDMPGADCHVD